MNKRVFRLVIFVAILACLIGAYFFLRSLDTPAEEANANEEGATIVLREYRAEDIVGIEYTPEGGETLAFTCKNGSWSYDADAEFPLTQDYLNQMVQSLASLNAQRKLEEDGLEELAAYGLDTPSLTLTLRLADGTLDTFELGDLNSYSNTYYLLLDGSVYMVDSTIATNAQRELFDYLSAGTFESIDDFVSFKVGAREYSDADTLNALGELYSTLSIREIAGYKDKESFGFDGTQTPSPLPTLPRRM